MNKLFFVIMHKKVRTIGQNGQNCIIMEIYAATVGCAFAGDLSSEAAM